MDFSNAHLWDDSAVSVIDKVIIKYHQNGIKVNLKGLNTENNKLIDKIAVYKPDKGPEKGSVFLYSFNRAIFR